MLLVLTILRVERFGRRSQRLRRPPRCSWFGVEQLSSDLFDRREKRRSQLSDSPFLSGQREAVAVSIARCVNHHTRSKATLGQAGSRMNCTEECCRARPFSSSSFHLAHFSAAGGREAGWVHRQK